MAFFALFSATKKKQIEKKENDLNVCIYIRSDFIIIGKFNGRLILKEPITIFRFQLSLFGWLSQTIIKKIWPITPVRGQAFKRLERLFYTSINAFRFYRKNWIRFLVTLKFMLSLVLCNSNVHQITITTMTAVAAAAKKNKNSNKKHN